jgi:hypothetical protein
MQKKEFLKFSIKKKSKTEYFFHVNTVRHTYLTYVGVLAGTGSGSGALIRIYGSPEPKEILTPPQH